MTIYLHTLFEKQVKRNPDAPAAKILAEEISYRELEEQSNRLANFLRGKGVRTGDCVCLCLKRSLDMLVAILGTLKSGAIYVPLDPKDPAARINFLLKDTGGRLLLTHQSVPIDFSCEQEIVCLTKDRARISAGTKRAPDLDIPDSRAAVILYTSGSTGQPKGVLLSHRSLVNRLIWDGKTYRHTPADIFLQHASYTFDFSVLEIFMALASGGKLILAKPDFYYDSNYLIQLIQNEKITKMGSGPSALKVYIDLPEFKKCTTLKQVFLGGEVLSDDLQKTFFKHLPAELINIYGPTETSISVLHWNCDRKDTSKIVPIGYPVADMEIYLLDDSRQRVPEGEIGEIFISGRGVAIGYHNRPKLTENRFLPNPFGHGPYARMYKSGDLGKKLPNGAFLFMGRKDHQVKIRGLRVELQEIEYHINRIADIRSCAVLGIDDSKQGAKLVAYIVPNNDCKIKIDTIKKHLRTNLPEYMVPSLFISLPRLPLSPNGKVDRKSLPVPDNVRQLSPAAYAPPMTPLQIQLTGIWEKVLNLSPIGIDDAFYDLGGNSLFAAEIFHLMQQEMDCKLPFTSLIKASTIRTQSEIILEGDHSPELIHVCRRGRRTPIIFIRHVQGNTTLSRDFMNRLDAGIPFIIAFPFGETPETVPKSIEDVARLYVDSLLKKYPHNSYSLCGYSMGGLVALEMAQQLKAKARNVENVFLIDTFYPELFLSKINSYQVLQRINFYLKHLLTGKRRVRLEIIKFLADKTAAAFKNLMTAKEIHPLLLNVLEWIHLSPDWNKQFQRDKNLALTLQYNPRPYTGRTLLISAKGQNRPYIYQDRSHQKDIKDNMQLWEKVFTENFHVIEIPGDHTSIIQEPGIKILADTINAEINNPG